MYTGYYVSKGHIHGPSESGRFYIADGYIHGPRNGGKYWLSEPGQPNRVTYIHGPIDSGQFYITEDGHIYGPSASLPWMRTDN